MGWQLPKKREKKSFSKMKRIDMEWWCKLRKCKSSLALNSRTRHTSINTSQTHQSELALTRYTDYWGKALLVLPSPSYSVHLCSAHPFFAQANHILSAGNSTKTWQLYQGNGSFCMYRKALYFWSLGSSLYLKLFCFLSFVSFVLRNLCSGTCRRNQGNFIWT